MKKLILATIVATFAAMTHAATADWSLFEISSPTVHSGDVSDLLVYFVDSGITSQADAATFLAAQDFAFLDSAYSAGLSVDGEAYATDGTYGNLETITGYAIIFDADTTAGATKYYMTSEESATTGGAGQSASMEFYATSSSDAGNWTAMAVPEPTSGLLMLLGMAGLALRRRRA